MKSISGIWERLTRGVRHTVERPDWPAFAGYDPEEVMRTIVTDHYHAKQGRSTGRWVLHAGDRTLSVYLKRHCKLPWWQRLLATFGSSNGQSPGLAEWQRLQWARENGLAVPEPVAAAEFVGPWFRLQSFLAVEELTGKIHLKEAIPRAQQQLDPVAFARWKRALVLEMARIVRQLHAARRFHKDLYLGHFYIDAADIRPGADFGGRLFLIDFHRLTHHSWFWWRWQVKDLAQLLFSSCIAGVTERDRVRFLWHYVFHTDAQKSRKGRWLAAVVTRKAGMYLRHNREAA